MVLIQIANFDILLYSFANLSDILFPLNKLRRRNYDFENLQNECTSFRFQSAFILIFKSN